MARFVRTGDRQHENAEQSSEFTGYTVVICQNRLFGLGRAVRLESPPTEVSEYLRQWELFFDQYAHEVDGWHHRNKGYHQAIASLARFYVSANSTVLEIGSGTGDLLNALQPSYGLGVDISGEMVRLAKSKYPHLQFQQQAAEHLSLPKDQFDFVILSDLSGYL